MDTKSPSFSNLKLIDSVRDAVKAKGYTHPTPIQAQAIPAILEGRDILGCAQTGTGKTAAFAIPTIQNLVQSRKSGLRKIRALVITPTRELAIQIDDSFKDYSKGSKIEHTVIFGGVKQHHQVKRLRSGVDVLIATPGRLVDLMNQKIITLQDLEVFILDEADRMLDMGFIHDVKKIIAKLPPKRQTLFFSATMPASISQLANSLLKKPVKIEVAPVSSTAESVTQHLYLVDKPNKKALLMHLLEDTDIKSALVFTRTKHGADKLAKHMNNAGIKTQAIHGNKSQNARQSALKNFKDQKTRILIATDIAARGIDINELSHVINFEIPNEPETYVHRIGRTGRAANTGIAISLCDTEEDAYVRDIHKITGHYIPIVEEHPYSRKAPQRQGANAISKPRPKRAPKPRPSNSRWGRRKS